MPKSLDEKTERSEPPPLRQAIVLVHGMGEQMPMETVRSFAESVWTADTRLHDHTSRRGELFYVPDINSGSRELRRISTATSRSRDDGRRVINDFFELYWADSTNGTTWRDFLLWYTRLVFRSPLEVPPPVRFMWVCLWLVNVFFVLAIEVIVIWLIPTEVDRAKTWYDAVFSETVRDTIYILLGAAGVGLAAVICGSLRLLPKWAGRWIVASAIFIGVWCVVVLIGLLLKRPISAFAEHRNVFWAGFIFVGSSTLLFLQGFLIRFFGDVARYTIASPGNIAPRQKVRDRGLALLKQLSASERHDRIILVAHSLGTMIAYDLLNLLWADYVSRLNKSNSQVPEVEAQSALAHALNDAALLAEAVPFDLEKFRSAQRRVFEELRNADRVRTGGYFADPNDPIVRWLISDFVTIACPLTHAEFLLARTSADLESRFRRRELSTCPPVAHQPTTARERVTHSAGIERDGGRSLNHDGVFAGVRWTNIHDAPESAIRFLQGDFVSGRLTKLFGKGICDVHVQPARRPEVLPSRLFTHTIYWDIDQDGTRQPPASVEAIRRAINILDEKSVEADLLNSRRSM